MDGDRNEAWWKRLGQAATWKETVTGRLVLSWRNWLDHRFSLTDDLVLPDVKGRRTFFLFLAVKQSSRKGRPRYYYAYLSVGVT